MQNCYGANSVRQALRQARNVLPLFNGPAGQHYAARIGTVAGFPRWSETVGTTEPADVAFPLGQIIRQPVEKTAGRFGSRLGAGGNRLASGACG